MRKYKTNFLNSCFHGSASQLHHRFPSGLAVHLVHPILLIYDSESPPGVLGVPDLL